MKTISRIDSTWTINEVIAAYPRSIEILNAFGLDTCCGGNDTLAQSAAAAPVELASLMQALESVQETQ